ncbi:hypothetical protein, partial [Jatrophihabitans endophyticus]|uniref:hypothetical protein n=1 Tax=Jatrophihabitans endophyticus TaxID=1206085 RepID=UPI0019F04750
DPDTLELRRHLVVRTRDPVTVRGTDDLDGGDRVDGSALVVAHGRHIELYRPTVRRTQRVTAPATVHDVSLSPDGSSLYAAVGPQTDSTVVQLDLHGAVRARTPTGSAELGLVATNFGFFGTLSTGMAAELDFFHLGNRTPEPISAGGGGSYPLVGLSDGVAWAGGSDALACVDPSTGTVAARVDLGGDRADISGLSALGGRLYADYDGTNGDPTHALIEMTPPRACGLS